MNAKTYVGIFIWLFSIVVLKAQMIQGYVFDTMTEDPIPGVTVYFDGTSIGTTTDLNGYFSIETKYKLSSTLLVSYMGYETIIIENPYNAAAFKIYLKETSYNLDEVVLQADPFSRAEKLEVFRRQFLGYPYKGKCQILNEDAIIVTYNMYTHTLMAMAKEPLQIRNEYLGYDVTYNLIDFKAIYNRNTLNVFQLNNVYFAGTSFFEDVSTDKNKYVRRRKSAYLGSSLHLIRTMTLQDKLKKDLKKEAFTLYDGSMPIKKPSDYFSIKDTLGGTRILAKKQRYNIIFNDIHEQSFMKIEADTIYVDNNGNFSPVRALMFGGYMGTLRFKEMLPLDYQLPDD